MRGAAGPGAAGLGPGPCCVLGVITSPANGVRGHSSCTCLGLAQVCTGRDEAPRAEVAVCFRRARTRTGSGGRGGVVPQHAASGPRGDTAIFFSDRRPLHRSIFRAQRSTCQALGRGSEETIRIPSGLLKTKAGLGDGHFGTTARSLEGPLRALCTVTKGEKGSLSAASTWLRNGLSQRALGQVRETSLAAQDLCVTASLESPAHSAAQVGNALLSPRQAGDGGDGG